MTNPKSLLSVSVSYAHNGSSTKANAFGKPDAGALRDAEMRNKIFFNKLGID